MNKNALSTIVSLGILFVVFYMFKDKLKGLLTGNKVGNTMRGYPALGALTAAGTISDTLYAPNGDAFQRISSGVDNTGAGNTGGLGITGSD